MGRDITQCHLRVQILADQFVQKCADVGLAVNGIVGKFHGRQIWKVYKTWAKQDERTSMIRM